MNRAEFGLALCAIAAVIAAVAVTAVLDENEGATTYYTITIDLGDGTAPLEYSVRSGYILAFTDNELTISGDTISLVRDGYRFMYWEGSDGGQYSESMLIFVNADLTLTACWDVREQITLYASGFDGEIILGDSLEFAIGASESVYWSASGLPEGVDIASTSTSASSTISGTPAAAGTYSIVITATATDGCQKTLSLDLSIYNKIVSGNNISITSLGTYAQTSQVSQTGDDLDVVWSITDGTLPEGFSFDSDTGVISGTYTGCTFQMAKLTLTVSSTKGPAQSATRTVTLYCEPSIALSGSTAVTAIVGTDAATYEIYALAAGDNPTCSAVTWIVNGYSGLSVDGGVLHVSEDAEITSGATVVVQAVTALGGSANRTVTLTIISSLCAETDPATDGTMEAL